LKGTVISALAESRLPDIRLKQFSFVFQDFKLLSALTALKNVAMVAELGLGVRLTFCGKKLSGGEKQRVAIARAPVNDPALILADEPTANLDSKIGQEIMRLLRHIAKEQPAGGGAGGRSVIIVSHDQRIKEIADRVLWLEDGEFRKEEYLR
jgi:putative ABC transport system ATP-binding protein